MPWPPQRHCLIVDYLKGMCGTAGKDHIAVTAVVSLLGLIGCFREIGFFLVEASSIHVGSSGGSNKGFGGVIQTTQALLSIVKPLFYCRSHLYGVVQSLLQIL